MSDTTTRGIRIEIDSEYLPDHSNRETYTFAYHVRISNVGEETAQLVSREWIITDGDGVGAQGNFASRRRSDLRA